MTQCSPRRHSLFSYTMETLRQRSFLSVTFQSVTPPYMRTNTQWSVCTNIVEVFSSSGDSLLHPRSPLTLSLTLLGAVEGQTSSASQGNMHSWNKAELLHILTEERPSLQHLNWNFTPLGFYQRLRGDLKSLLPRRPWRKGKLIIPEAGERASELYYMFCHCVKEKNIDMVSTDRAQKVCRSKDVTLNRKQCYWSIFGLKWKFQFNHVIMIWFILKYFHLSKKKLSVQDQVSVS